MMAPAMAAICRLVSGATVEWRCEPHGHGQRVYFGNHSSHLDFIVIWSALPPRLRAHVRPVAGRDYWSRGRLRRYLAHQVFRAVLIERHQPRTGPHHPGAGDDPAAAAKASVDVMTRAMGERDSLIVFPEGTRGAGDSIGPFKSGLYHVARTRPQAQLVPVLLENLNRILPKGESLPVPMLSRVTFGPPLHVGADESKDEFLTRARTALLDLRWP